VSALPLALSLYRSGSGLAVPLAPLLLAERARRGKEDRKRLGERRGETTRQRPRGRLAWLHGASVGETMALLPLVERLIERGVSVLVTSGTVTSARLLERRLPPGAVHQFVPLDFAPYARRFLDHWRPDLALVAESELWPNLILEADARRIPLVLVNGRMSERSYRRWQKLGDSIAALLGRFTLCLAQSPADAQRYAALGAPHVGVAGNLKYDVPPLPADPLKLSALRGLVGGRPVWVAASTHPGEEQAILGVHKVLGPRFPGLLTIIVPRHPQRGEEVAALASAASLRASRRSANAPPDGRTEVYVADTMGELGLFYRLAPLVFMGGSLVPHGGQNPIEPAKLGAAILHGTHVHNFTDVYATLDQAGGAVPVSSGEDLARLLERLMRDGPAARALARRATDSVGSLSGASSRIMTEIEPLLQRLPAGAG
jgi:3-deoxy-D-manno-octulosonic-acid transferase